MGGDPRPATRGAAVAIDRQRAPAEGGLRDEPFDPPALRGRAAGRGGFIPGAATGRRGARRARAGPASGHPRRRPAGGARANARRASQRPPPSRAWAFARSPGAAGRRRRRAHAEERAGRGRERGPGLSPGQARGDAASAVARAGRAWVPSRNWSWFGAARGGGTCARGGGLSAWRKAAAQARGAGLGRVRVPQHREHDADLGLVLGVRLPGCLCHRAARGERPRARRVRARPPGGRARAGRAASPAGGGPEAGRAQRHLLAKDKTAEKLRTASVLFRCRQMFYTNFIAVAAALALARGAKPVQVEMWTVDA